MLYPHQKMKINLSSSRKIFLGNDREPDNKAGMTSLERGQ